MSANLKPWHVEQSHNTFQLAHAVFTSDNSRKCESHKMRVNALFGAKQSRRPHASPRERRGHVDNSNCMKEG